MKVYILLNDSEIDSAILTDYVGVVLFHQLTGAADDAAHSRLADEQMVRLLGQHEAAGARQRIESRLGQARQLILAVAVGEMREHEVREPVGRLLVERAEDARIVRIARSPHQQCVGLFAAVASEVSVQQIDHRPQMAPFLDVDLEQIAQIVKRRAGPAQVALLFDRRGLGVALRDDQAAQDAAMFARNFAPDRLALVLAERNPAIGLRLREKKTPSVVPQLYLTEFGPAPRRG